MKNWIICILSILYWRKIMFNFIVGFILGIVVATIGFTGVIKAFDNGIETY